MLYSALLLGAAFGAVTAGVALGGFAGVDGWALDHLMPWLGPGAAQPTLRAVLLPFNAHTARALIPANLWVYPASVPVSALLVVLAGARLWRSGRRQAAVAWATAWVAVNVFEVIGKALVSRPALTKLEHGTRQVYFHHSFPSGHALRGVLVAVLVGLVWRRARAASAVWIAATLVLLVVIAFHTPSDVLGGALLSGAVIALTLWYLEAREARVRPTVGALPPSPPPGDSRARRWG